jgi:hypothetical protein
MPPTKRWAPPDWKYATCPVWLGRLTEDFVRTAMSKGLDRHNAQEQAQIAVMKLWVRASKQGSSDPESCEAATRFYAFEILQNVLNDWWTLGKKTPTPTDPHSLSATPAQGWAHMDRDVLRSTLNVDEKRIKELITFFMQEVFRIHYLPLRNSPLMCSIGKKDSERFEEFCKRALLEQGRSAGSRSSPISESVSWSRYRFSRRRIMTVLFANCSRARAESTAETLARDLHELVQDLNKLCSLYEGNWSTGHHATGLKNLQNVIKLGWGMQDLAVSRAALRNADRTLQPPRVRPCGTPVLDEDQLATDELIAPRPEWFREQVARKLCVDNDGEQQ